MRRRKLHYDRVRAFWNGRAGKAGSMDSRSITFFCEEAEALDFRDRREKALFDERVTLGGAESVLEAGCGSGRWTSFLARRCGRLTAFDFASDLVEVNRKAVEEAGLTNVDFVVSDVLSLDLPEDTFDLVVCFGVSLYVNDEDLLDAYANLGRPLRRGGVLLAKEPTAVRERLVKNDEFSENLGARYSCIYRPRAELEDAVARAGFEREWAVPVYGSNEPLAPQREGIETWFSRWVKGAGR